MKQICRAAVLASITAAALVTGATAAPAPIHQPQAAAQAPTAEARRVQLAERLFQVMHLHEALDDMMVKLAPSFVRALGRPESVAATPAMQEAVAEATQAYLAAYERQVAQMYAEVFTEEELLGMINFYETPVGQSVLKKAPSMSPKMLSIVLTMVPDLQKDITSRYCAKTGCDPAATAPKS